MSNKTALVTGATGLLGRQVLLGFSREGWSVIGTGYSRAQPPSILKLDLNDHDAISATLDDVKPQVVVHCAANRFPDKCDADPTGTRALNVLASQHLAQLCTTRSILLIYISTDYVFPGTRGDAPYAATAAPRPSNLYGQTKLDGERAVLDAYAAGTGAGAGRVVVLRVPVLYGQAESAAESAVNGLMDAVWRAQEETVGMDHWAVRYPTNTEDVGRVCQDIAKLYLASQDPSTLPSILQFSSEDAFTKYEICQLFAEILGLPLTRMKPNTQGNDPNAAVQRPYDCHLSTKELKDLGISVATQDFTAWWRRECRAFRH